MRYQLSEIEEVEAQRQAKERQFASGRISMNRTDLQVSGSSWNALHLKAFRVVNIDNCPLSRLFSTNHIPNDADKEFKSAVQRVTAVTEDELRTYDSNISTKHKYNVFSAFFDSLAKLVSTRPYTQPKRTDYDQRKTPESDLSHSSQEDKEEMGTNVCLEKFLSACLKETELGGLSNNRHLVCDERPLNVNICMGNKVVHAKTDGGILIQGQARYTGSSRFDQYPTVFMETKRRNGAGVHRESGDKEKFVEAIMAQELSELLGQATVHCQESGGAWKDQESWGIMMHGTEIRIVTAFFSEAYLRNVSSPFMHPKHRLVIFRSEPFNVKYDYGRIEAVRMVIALLRYLKSGDAKIELLRLAMEQEE